MEQVVLGGGCFWCLEAAYQLIEGVTKVVSGYAGGKDKNPNYYSVASGRTGHAEVVQITFSPRVISLEGILEIFWTIHDPTTLNKQGNDTGTQYRSIILYTKQQQKAAVEKSLRQASRYWVGLLTTEVKPLDIFYEAEAEQQNFFRNHPEQSYCQVIINPKLQKLRERFQKRLRKD